MLPKLHSEVARKCIQRSASPRGRRIPWWKSSILIRSCNLLTVKLSIAPKYGFAKCFIEVLLLSQHWDQLERALLAETDATQAQAMGSESSSNMAEILWSFASPLGLNQEPNAWPDQRAKTSLGALHQVPRRQVRRKPCCDESTAEVPAVCWTGKRGSPWAPCAGGRERQCLEVLQQFLVNLFGNRNSANAPCCKHSRSVSDNAPVSGRVSSQPQPI